jgi:integrase
VSVQLGWCFSKHYAQFCSTVAGEGQFGLANFLVMRRTHATLMKALGVDGKLVADQLGHSLDVNQNVIRNRPSKAAWRRSIS